MGIHRYLKKLTTKQTQSARIGAPSKPPTRNLVSWLTTHYKLALFIILPLGLFLPLRLLVQLPGFDYLVTTSSKLGSFMPFAILVGLLITAATSYFIIDYHLHRKPLRDEQPKIAYTPLHHIKVVSLPLVKYRWRSVSYWIFVGTTSLVVLSYLLGVSMVGLAAPGSLTVTINQKSGTADSNPSYTSVFTVQFNEPIDEATLTNSDITLGGTAPGQQVQSITEAGTFNKTTYEVRIQATSAGTITPTIAQELITAQNGASGTNQASTSTDNSVTYNGDWAPNEFVTTWKTDNPGGSSSNQIIIPTAAGETYNYNVDWGDGNTSTGQTGNALHTYASPGTYTVTITGSFPRIYSGAGDVHKILTIEQWSSNQWTSMHGAFNGASNVQIPAIDSPNLSNVTDMGSMFDTASTFNSNINHWDVSNVTDLSYAFIHASSFNQPLNSWNVENVLTLDNTFDDADSFNQPLNNWDVSSVTDFTGIFAWNNSFNQPLNNWDTSNVVNMQGAFMSATSFNQSINSWDVGNVTDMSSMFGLTSSFNQPLNNWQTDSVVNMSQMFAGSAFNQPLNSWHVGNVTNMSVMFAGSSFNQSLASWNVSSVTSMSMMFGDAGGNLPNSSSLSTLNYDATLASWSSQTLQNNVTFDAGTSKYCTSEAQRQSIITNHSWTINDGGKQCPPLTTVTSSATAVTQDSATLNGVASPQATGSRGFQYGTSISYGQTIEDTDPMNFGYRTMWGSSGSGDGQFDGAQDTAIDSNGNVYTVEHTNQRVQKFDSNGNFISKWGTPGTGDGQFSLPVSIAIDSNNNVYVLDATQKKIQKFDSNGNFITSWGGPLYSAYGITVDENNDIYVTDYSRVIKFDSNGNELFSWGSYGTGNGQFIVAYGIASDKNGNIYVADVNNGRIQRFDNNGNYITQWSASGVYNLTASTSGQIYAQNNMSGSTIFQYSSNGSLLNQWNSSAGGLIAGLDIAKDGVIYAAQTNKIAVFGTEISSDVSGLTCETTYHYRAYSSDSNGTYYGTDKTFTTGSCPPDPTTFITTWKTDNPGVSASNQITIPTFSGETYNYNVDWGDSTASSNQTGDSTHDYASPGTYTVTITGTFPRIYFNGTTDHDKILTVEQWGTNPWTSMNGAFAGATNLTSPATDMPNLSGVTDMSFMFRDATMFNSDIDNWDVSNVTNIAGMFERASSFNQSLSNWNTVAVTDMSWMFAYATSFNQPLNSWNVSNVTTTSSMFWNATSFNQPLDDWSTSNVVDMSSMFDGATNFNQSLNTWDVSSVIGMRHMFASASSFNQPLDSWDTSAVEDMGALFFGARSFNQPLNTWDVENVTAMDGMFAVATSFNQPLNNWNVSNVVNMEGMFSSAISFNQSLALWNMSNVASMDGMFGDWVNQYKTIAEIYFYGPYSTWDQSTKDQFWGYISGLFGYPINELSTPNSSGLSTPNYDATLISWSAQNLESSVVFDAGASKYCLSETQRQSIIDNHTWTINDEGKDCAIQPPQNLVGTAHSKSIEVDWDDVAGADHYKLEYKPTSSSTWAEYTANIITGSYLEITNLEMSTSYDIRVKAIDSLGTESSWSDILTISTLAQATYHITDCQELQSITVNPITYEIGDPYGKYILDNDIDCAETENWYWPGIDPEANIPSGFLAMPFNGELDGQEHTVTNLYQNTEFTPSGGIFSLTNGASIHNLKIHDFTKVIGPKESFSQNGQGGGIIVSHALDSTISNVQIVGLKVTGESSGVASGAVGTVNGATIEESSVTGSIVLSEYNSEGRFDQPIDIANDGTGNIYVLDAGNKRVQKFDSNGNYLSQFGSSSDPVADQPGAIAVDNSGNIYVSDLYYRVIKKFDSNGNYLSQFGSRGSNDGQFENPNDIIIDAGGSIIVADSGNHRVQKFDSSGNYLSQFGTIGSGNGQFSDLSGIALDDSGNIYSVETSNHRVQKFDSSGNYLSQFDTDTFADASFNAPVRIVIDSDDNLYITAGGNLKTRKFTNTGTYLSDVGTTDEIFAPHGILINITDEIVISDVMRNSLTRYSNLAEIQNSWGRYGKDDFYGISVGGMAGNLFNGGTISKSWTDIDITVDASGSIPTQTVLVTSTLLAYGYDGTINNSYSRGSITANGGPAMTGGIAGTLYTMASINNSYSTTDITETNNQLPQSFGSPWPIGTSMSGGLIGTYIISDVHINNSFFAGSTQSNLPINSLVSMIATDNTSAPIDNLSNVFYDQDKSSIQQCAGPIMDMNTMTFLSTQVSGCTPVNTDGSQPNYFKNNSTNPPLNQWDFASIWKTNCTNYPDFVGSAGCNPSTPSPSPTPTSTPSPTPTRSPTPTSQPTLTTSLTPTASTDPNVSPPASGSDGGTSSGSTRPTTKTSPKPSGPGLATDQVGFFSKGGPLWSFAAQTAPGLPFMFVSLLLLIALAYAVQSWREYRFERSVQALIDRYQATDQHIHDFINITAHYLNTPVAILQNALDLLQSQQLVTALTYTSLADQLKDLGQFASGLQHTTQESLANTPSTAANTMPGSHKANPKLTALIALKDRPVWISLLAVAIIIAVVDITLTLTGAYIVSGLRVVNQLAFFIFCVILILVSGYLYHKHKTRRQKQVDLLREIRNLHQTKQAFLDESSQKLQSYIDFLTTNSSELQAHPEQSKLYLNGLAMLTELGRALGFVTTHAGAVNTTTTSLVAPAIQAVLPGLQQQAQARNITLEVDTPSAVTAQAEPEHLGELTEILVGNAIKFSPEGSKVSLQVKATGQHVTIAVTDAGSGLSDSARQHLFEPFSRGTSTETYDSQGLGMGLYNAQFLVQSLGGIIKLQATRPTGTLATITLHSGKLAKLPG